MKEGQRYAAGIVFAGALAAAMVPSPAAASCAARQEILELRFSTLIADGSDPPPAPLFSTSRVVLVGADAYMFLEVDVDDDPQVQDLDLYTYANANAPDAP
jgi:hypothetical protein